MHAAAGNPRSSAEMKKAETVLQKAFSKPVWKSFIKKERTPAAVAAAAAAVRTNKRTKGMPLPTYVREKWKEENA